MKLSADAQMIIEQTKEKALEMQDRIKQEVDAIRVKASTGGGMVTVGMDGNKNVTSIELDPESVEDIEMLQDMLQGAFNEAVRRVETEKGRKLNGVVGSMFAGGLKLPKLDD